MSWEAYSDLVLLRSGGYCTYGSIQGTDGAKWSDSKEDEDFELSAEERVVLSRIIKTEDNSVYETGYEAHGIRFAVVRKEPNLIMFRGKGLEKEKLLVAMSSKSSMVIGYSPGNGRTLPEVRISVDRVVNNLAGVGF